MGCTLARIRTIKPEFFRHYNLYIAEKEDKLPLRVAFAGLWTACDREGRFKWNPESLKLDCLPYDNLDFSRVLDALLTRGFIVKYGSNGAVYGCIPSFSRHQVINNRERLSDIPSPKECEDLTRAPREPHACPTRLNLDQGEGKGREREKEGNKEGDKAESIPCSPPVLRLLTCYPNQWHNVSQEDTEHWSSLYPGVDVMQELRKMIGWLETNPKKRKTPQGTGKFITSWLSSAQDRSRLPFSRTTGIHENNMDVLQRFVARGSDEKD